MSDSQNYSLYQNDLHLDLMTLILKPGCTTMPETKFLGQNLHTYRHTDNMQTATYPAALCVNNFYIFILPSCGQFAIAKSENVNVKELKLRNRNYVKQTTFVESARL